ncbi:hypothetical protein glysoja_046299 [Glycine soja]|uniref:Uncharacterized protein n=1 Tax=Glycine soja TaxID=3848 RepID=A0A0B2R089_GLYSO|nr:hypothetical protein glysoja_046299 [Glycine soja]
MVDHMAHLHDAQKEKKSWVISDLTNTGIMDKTSKESNANIANEVRTCSIELCTLHCCNHRSGARHDWSSHGIICKIIMKGNEQFRFSMQNLITTQFSNLGVVLLQNLQQAHMSMLRVVVEPTPMPIPIPLILEPTPSSIEPTPPPPTTQPPPPPPIQD